MTENNKRHNWKKLQKRSRWEDVYAALRSIQAPPPLTAQDMRPRLVKKPIKVKA
jgi:hypothetical protein